jgi:hypothetical protein
VSVATLTDKVSFIESVFGSGRLARNCKNIDVRCPICAPKDPSKKKLSIRTDDDRNHCWTCDWHAASLAPLLRKFGTQAQLSDYRERFMPAWERARKEAQLDVNVEQRLALPSDFSLLTTISSNDRDVKESMSYALGKRNLTMNDLWFFKIGVSKDVRWKRRLIFPSFDVNGELNYFVARAIDDFVRPRYDNPDIDKLPIIFNEINIDWDAQLVICEGAFDLISCGSNAAALLGSSLNENSALFNKILLNNTPVALALDGDIWETKTLKIAEKLIEYNVDVVLVDVREFGDPGKATKDQFKEALESAKQMDWIHALKTRLGLVSQVRLRIN